jgi:hypothetical protein
MVSHLIQLNAYLQLIEKRAKTMGDCTGLLSPFMVAQKLLEGEAYVTISFIPLIIYKISKGLQGTMTNERSSQHVITTASRMFTEFNNHFGSVVDGTVATENFTEGSRRRPKG